MIIIVDNVPAHVVLLKGTKDITSAPADSKDGATHAAAGKYLPFGKSLAAKLLRLSKQGDGGWRTKIVRLPKPKDSGQTPTTSADTKTSGIPFCMVKVNAKQRYALIVIRMSGGGGTHGIFVTPASELSPIGFGSPYTLEGEDINSGWGITGVTLESLIKEAEAALLGQLGGKHFQCIIEAGDATKEPPTEPKFLFGTKRLEYFDGSSETNPTGTLVGGSLAVTGAVKAGEEPEFVFSVGSAQLGWIGAQHVGHKHRIVDPKLQSEGVYNVDPVSSYTPIHFSDNESGPIFCNGSVMEFVEDIPEEGYVFDSTTGFVAVGVKSVVVENQSGTEETRKRLIAIGVLGRVDNDERFTGDYLLCYSDPPYDALIYAQVFTLEYWLYPDASSAGGRGRTSYTCDKIAFQFNESGTRASAVARGHHQDFLATSGSTYSQVVHLDISADGTSCTVTREPQALYTVQSELDQSGDIQFSNTVYTYEDAVFAIGYVGDVEKRAIWSRERWNTSHTDFIDMTNTRAETANRVTVTLGEAAVEVANQLSASEGWNLHVWTDNTTRSVLGVDFVNEVIYTAKVRSYYGQHQNEMSDSPGYGDGRGWILDTPSAEFSILANDAVLWSQPLTSVESVPHSTVYGNTGDAATSDFTAVSLYGGPNMSATITQTSDVYCRSWIAVDHKQNVLFTCYVPKPLDASSTGQGVTFSKAGTPTAYFGSCRADQFPDGIQIARYTTSDGVVHELSEEFTVPGTHVGWKYAGVF
jgi:hypothetical protein